MHYNNLWEQAPLFSPFSWKRNREVKEVACYQSIFAVEQIKVKAQCYAAMGTYFSHS
jgi:hypothetical protein